MQEHQLYHGCGQKIEDDIDEPFETCFDIRASIPQKLFLGRMTSIRDR